MAVGTVQNEEVYEATTTQNTTQTQVINIQEVVPLFRLGENSRSRYLQTEYQWQTCCISRSSQHEKISTLEELSFQLEPIQIEEDQSYIDPIDVFFPPWEREKARCIRFAESRNLEYVVSSTDDWGWFQIHAGIPRDGTTYQDHVAKHGYTGWRAYFGETRWAMVLDPWENTSMAYEIWLRGGWSAWMTDDGRCG